MYYGLHTFRPNGARPRIRPMTLRLRPEARPNTNPEGSMVLNDAQTGMPPSYWRRNVRSKIR